MSSMRSAVIYALALTRTAGRPRGTAASGLRAVIYVINDGNDIYGGPRATRRVPPVIRGTTVVYAHERRHL